MRHQCNDPEQIQQNFITDWVYVNPLNNFRNYKNHNDLLFIIFSSSNFLHDGSFFTHLNDFPIISNVLIDYRHVPFYV